MITAILAPTWAVACGGGDNAASGGRYATTTAAPTTTAPAPTTSAAPTTTASLPPISFPSPDAAGSALYKAWTTSNREAAGALRLAPPSELDKLFAARPVAAKNRGCDAGSFGEANCFFGNGQGGVNVALAPAQGGWAIIAIDPFG